MYIQMDHEGFEPVQRMRKTKKIRTLILKRSYLCNNLMAGCESSRGNTLLSDFILFAQKLEQLGFVYHRGRVVIIEK